MATGHATSSSPRSRDCPLRRLAAWNSSSVFPEADYKFRFPGLDEYSTPDRRVDLGQLNNDGYIGMTPPTPGGRPQLQDRDILDESTIGGRKRRGDEPTLPKLIVIAVSGGGIRSAVWTAVVLEGLEQEIPGKPGQAAFAITSDSSPGPAAAWSAQPSMSPISSPTGLIAATQLPTPMTRTRLRPLAGPLSEQSLLPTIQTAVIRDFSRNLFVPPWKPVAYDRGRSLEDKWMFNARERGYGPPGTTAKGLAELRAPAAAIAIQPHLR